MDAARALISANAVLLVSGIASWEGASDRAGSYRRTALPPASGGSRQCSRRITASGSVKKISLCCQRVDRHRMGLARKRIRLARKRNPLAREQDPVAHRPDSFASGPISSTRGSLPCQVQAESACAPPDILLRSTETCLRASDFRRTPGEARLRVRSGTPRIRPFRARTLASADHQRAGAALLGPSTPLPR